MIHGSDADIGYWDCPRLTGNSCRKEKELRFEVVLNCTEYFYYDLLWVYPFSDLSSWRAFTHGSIKKKAWTKCLWQVIWNSIQNKTIMNIVISIPKNTI